MLFEIPLLPLPAVIILLVFIPDVHIPLKGDKISFFYFTVLKIREFSAMQVPAKRAKVLCRRQ